MGSPRVLIVVAHPVIASGIETLLKLEGDYDVKRVANLADASRQKEAWRPDVALVDGTLLAGYTTIALGTPAYVLSGNERDGGQLARKLDDGRGWLRKDATGAELAEAISGIVRRSGEGPQAEGIGTLGVSVIVVLSVLVLALVAYLVWTAVY